ncbi:hypothetical protein BMS3Abin01_00389 [bacterium BMS3Abin01]|nr:hypothetical protein BMS3Abin01_00389 [bacterium BMS3Abin01]
MTIGPIHLTVIRFDGNDFKGGILPELKAVRRAGIIRLLDLMLVSKDGDGNLTSMQISDLDEDEARGYGSVIGGLIGLGAGGVRGALAGAQAGALALYLTRTMASPQRTSRISAAACLPTAPPCSSFLSTPGPSA